MTQNNGLIESFLAYFCNETNSSVERKKEVKNYLSIYSHAELADLEKQIYQGLKANNNN